MKILVLDDHANAYRGVLTGVDADIAFETRPDDAAPDFDILLAQPELAATYLRRCGSVRWIQSTWAGIKPLVEPAREHDVVVTSLKGIFGPLIAEYVFSYILDDTRKNQLFKQQQQRSAWSPAWPDRLSARTMLVIGTGAIGAHVATIGRAFGMRVTGLSRSGDAVPEFHEVHAFGQLNKIAGDADYVVVVLPETPETIALIDADALSALKPSAMLINVGRGATVSEASLVKALDGGRLRAAVLDVFETEPLPPSSPLWRMDNVTITPHIAGVSFPADVARVFLDNLDRFRAGSPLRYQVDLVRGY